jgi:hypothetical protein
MKKPKPCKIPCPKCGSAAINREFMTKGDVFDRAAMDDCRPKSEFVQHNDVNFCQEAVVKQDCIDNHCRVCQYNWETAPL